MSSILISYILLSMISANNAIYLNNIDTSIVPQRGVISGGVSQSKELPAEFYGTWSVSSAVIETNDPVYYKARGSDIWTFQKDREIITLTNPSTGATASITVDEVKGHSAIFTRVNNNPKFKEHEQVNMTVDGDNFYGTDSIETEYYRRGKYLYTSVVKYDITGKKITGPALKNIFAE